MGYVEIEAMLEHSRSKRSDRAVMLVLAHRSNPHYGYAWLSVERLAREAGVTRRTVDAALPRLEKLGELRIERGAGPKGTHRFYLTLSCRDPDEALRGQPLPGIAHAHAHDWGQPLPGIAMLDTAHRQSALSPRQSVHATRQSTHATPAVAAPKGKEENRREGEENPAHARAREGVSDQSDETRIPPDFRADAAIRERARQAGMPESFVDSEEINFREKWQWLGGVKADWQAAFWLHLMQVWSTYQSPAREAAGG